MWRDMSMLTRMVTHQDNGGGEAAISVQSLDIRITTLAAAELKP